MPRLDAKSALVKQLSYRLPVAAGEEQAALAAMAQHWAGFQWETGRTIVEWCSQTHGNVQVWAASKAEGQGVVLHALAHMGVNEKEGDWVFTESKSTRNGRSGTVMAMKAAVRDGASGQPLMADFGPELVTIQGQAAPRQ